MFRLLAKGYNVLVDSEILTVIRVRQQGSISVHNRAENWLRYTELRVKIIQHLRESGQYSGSRAETAMQILFNAIRILYNFNKHDALRIYNTELPKGFQPQPSTNTSSLYCKIYSVFGFSWTERLRHIFRRSL